MKRLKWFAVNSITGANPFVFDPHVAPLTGRGLANGGHLKRRNNSDPARK